MLTVVHAQSPRRIERCAELGREPSDGESAFPRSEFLIRVRCKRKKNYRWASIKPCLGAQGSQIRADWRLEPSAALSRSLWNLYRRENLGWVALLQRSFLQGIKGMSRDPVSDHHENNSRVCCGDALLLLVSDGRCARPVGQRRRRGRR